MAIGEWEVWWAFVKFEDSSQIKRRPVLILGTGEIALIAPLTSHKPRKGYVGEYELRSWQKIGLSKPSVIRLSKKGKINSKYLDCKIGVLPDGDIERIKIVMEFHRL
ncbi:MAG: type II toxin-antitoxin system PemK/MazF family toxin [Negativicoccus succinicivorans]|uniref:type II toxin-antitoxin system PemK/MazF family toxin n=1 Tax=Negativicoccus succinicivorans TaxID=620903 RepID=UPI0020710351|nr:type II toxin-antitoxin system PemK/MazF family toxin [Negativicoccus succinicivorans]MDU2929041.1 type II toxin-antitoxin system PemK/MazF family toxin [Negativicoccus succinicivorans]MDU5027103.1 type II toxin-antitoxin system PemK/MazF family toxin [Negativicoccus succinicivorans]DAH87086.1 MAG TPA: PemK-like protein [Caudoviricetes sp.]